MDAGTTKLIVEGVKAGDRIKDFQGQEWLFRYVTNGPISHGKIVAAPVGGGDAREFFASVFPTLKIKAAS